VRSGVEINWRSFALEQSNSKEGPEWKAWEQGPGYESRGLLALSAAEAAKRQGEEPRWKFVLALLKAKHVDRSDVRERNVVVDTAKEAGLDVARFERDLDDPETLKQVGRDHEAAVSQGIFGTPTYVFEDARPAFLKMYIPPEEQTLEVWDHFVGLARDVKFLGELKRPQPPWPQGVFEDS
jgi:hypothetical protein